MANFTITIYTAELEVEYDERTIEFASKPSLCIIRDTASAIVVSTHRRISSMMVEGIARKVSLAR